MPDTRIAMITGAGQGMGRAIALNFATQGIESILIGRTESKLQRVADEIVERNGHAHILTCDLTDTDAIERSVVALPAAHLDILVNCAGDWLIKPIDETSTADLDHIIDINLKAPYHLSRLCMPHLRKSQNASIINIGSMAAVHSFGGITAYTAAKTGLRGLTGSLAAELKPDLIRVMMLSPSPANTPMRWEASPDMDPKMLVEPETIAEIVSVIVNLPRGIAVSDFVLESMHLIL
jgi:NAD(P)-dependent dehydrogenase (short-subunit alcohol dehydrogenase family)